jgi:chromate transporter
LNLWGSVEVFISMAKVGVVGFGGGNALITLIEREAVNVRGWLTQEEFKEMIGYSFAVPGLSAGKLAALVGWEHAGVLGMFTGLLGLWSPGMVLLMGVWLFLRQYTETAWYPRLMVGVLFASAGLVAASVMSALPKRDQVSSVPLYAVGLVIATAVFVVIWKYKVVPPIAVVFAGAVLGLLIF